jgi:serine/threonine protein kinase
MDQRFGPYQVGETIGRGSFAKVKVAVHEATKQKVALKVIPRKVIEQDPKSELKIKREVKIMQSLQHPHIMRLFDVIQTRHDIILVLEHVAGGELFDYLSRRGKLDEPLARQFFQQLTYAMSYCHSKDVAHRDLKPENIMLDHSMKSIKLGDFGLSSVMRDGRFFETSCGTPHYAAPEIVSGKLYGGKEADMWSCGVVLYTMLAGCLPFDSQHISILFKKIQNAEYTMPTGISVLAQDLLRGLLVSDPLNRATTEQVLKHRWVRDTVPRYLVHIHTFDDYEDAKSGLDKEIIATVAARFRMLPQRVEAVIVKQLREAVPRRRDLPKTPEALRKITCPSEVVIPLAEVQLRDESHDVFVSYIILLNRKKLRDTIDTVTQAPPVRYTDPSSLGPDISPMSITTGGKAWGSLQAFSVGPRSLRPNAVAYAPGQLYRVPDGTVFSPAPTLVTRAQKLGGDPYMESFNVIQTVELRLECPTSQNSLLASFFNIPVRPGVGTHGDVPDSHDQQSSQLEQQRQVLDDDSYMNGPLLRPLEQSVADDDIESVQQSSLSSVVVAEGEAGRFAQEFLHNGVRFENVDGSFTMGQLYTVLRQKGFMWKKCGAFSLVAVRQPDVKIITSVFKVPDAPGQYIVDLRASNLTGMVSVDACGEVYEALADRACRPF